MYNAPQDFLYIFPKLPSGRRLRILQKETHQRDYPKVGYKEIESERVLMLLHNGGMAYRNVPCVDYQA